MNLLYHMYNDIVVNTEFFKEKFINKIKKMLHVHFQNRALQLAAFKYLVSFLM